MMLHTYRDIAREGLWTNNPGLVQLLGLCPLLAVSNTVINALGLGLATTAVLVGSNFTVSGIRRWVRPEVRIPIFVLVIASFVTAVELVMSAYFHSLYRVLGIFIPLIVTNCTIIGRAEAFASRNTIPRAVVDGLAMGVGFTLVLAADIVIDMPAGTIKEGSTDRRPDRDGTNMDFPFHIDPHDGDALTPANLPKFRVTAGTLDVEYTRRWLVK